MSEKPSDITPNKISNTLETNGPQNSSSSSENGTKSDNDTSSLLTNGESGKRKTLREYLAALPGFSMKVKSYLKLKPVLFYICSTNSNKMHNF